MPSVLTMELNNGANNKSDDADMVSMLTDDVLLCILGRIDIISAVKTSVLSTRWRHLPWLLPEISVDVEDFLSIRPSSGSIEIENIGGAMESLTKAAMSFLAVPRREGPITKLQLKLYLINNYSSVIGPLLSEAIDIGTFKDLDLAILDEKEIPDCTDKHMLQQASVINDLFSSYPNVLNCLTRLSLHNVLFAKWDIHHHLLECCKELRYLSFSNCDAGKNAVWKIDAPNSKLSVLELTVCQFGRLEVLCLPRLEQLRWEAWMCSYAPLSFDVVQSLEEVSLICGALDDNEGFMLSEMLSGTTNIHTLKLDFQGEKLWIQPEGNQLCHVFKKLRKLSIHGIFAEFDLLWTTVLLEAAPSLEIFDIEIWEHPCQVGDHRNFLGERTNPSWKAPGFTSSRNSLKELQIVGFRPLKRQLEFIRTVMKHAPNLATVLLKYDDPCEDCEAIGFFPPRSSTECIYPSSKDEQDKVVNLIRDGVCSPANIIFQ